MADLRAILQNVAKGEFQQIYSKVGTISEVNVGERTCSLTPFDGGVAIFGVRLQASLNNAKGVVGIPKEGTMGIVTFINKYTGYLSHADEVDEVLIDTELVTINGGTNGGLINIETLIAELNKNNSILNAIKNTFSSFVPGVGDGGLALKTAMVSALSSLTVGDFGSMEDEKIKH